jgi:hypothetical protein
MMAAATVRLRRHDWLRPNSGQIAIARTAAHANAGRNPDDPNRDCHQDEDEGALSSRCVEGVPAD